MRHQRGFKWNNFWMNTRSRNVLQSESQELMNNFRGRGCNSPYPRGSTYVGRCKCGFGPNAFYKNAKGEIIHANQIIQNRSSGKMKNSQEDIMDSMAQNFTPKMEYYRTCNKCGAHVVEEALFCSECGNMLDEFYTIPSKKERIDAVINRIKELKNQIKEIKRSDV